MGTTRRHFARVSNPPPLTGPLTGLWRTFAVDRKETMHVGIANVIKILTTQSLVRRPLEINNDVTNTLQEML